MFNIAVFSSFSLSIFSNKYDISETIKWADRMIRLEFEKYVLIVGTR